MWFTTSVSEKDLLRLFTNFSKIDQNGDGLLQRDEFMAIEPLQQNPLVSRVLEIFDSDRNDMIDFTEFTRALSIFCSAEEKEQKLLCMSCNCSHFLSFRWFNTVAFKIYDVNNDGYISNGDLFTILKIMVGDNLNDTQLQQLVDRTILQADKDKDGKLSLQEFVEVFFFFMYKDHKFDYK